MPDRSVLARLTAAFVIALAAHVAALDLSQTLLKPRAALPAAKAAQPVIVLAHGIEAQPAAPQPELPSPRRQSLQGTVPADAGTPGLATYLATSDVDRPAAPLQDWQIDTTRLPLGVLYRAVLNIWVDATGEVQNVEVLELTPDDESARKVLQKIYGTPMSPALLQSRPVGNVRHIEISFGQE